jgi:peptide/nickel transport system permease protein
MPQRTLGADRGPALSSSIPGVSPPRVRTWRRGARLVDEVGPLAVLGAVIALVLILLAVVAPLIAAADPTTLNVLKKFRAPGQDGFLLGSDFFGRDLFSRLTWGGRTTLLAGALVIGLAAGVGIILGLLAGQVGGWTDEILMRLADAMLAFPSLVLAIAIASALGPGLTNALVAVTIAYTPQFMRVARGQARAIATQPFVEAARAVGVGPLTLLARHVAPNCVGPLGVQASLNLGGAILATASLGFLGLGVQAPTPEWGADVAASTVYMREAPWPALVPGLAIVLAVLAVNLVADGVVDRLNPKLRKR